MEGKMKVTRAEFWRIVNERLKSHKWCEEVEVSPGEGPEELIFSGPPMGKDHPCIEHGYDELNRALREFEIKPDDPGSQPE